MLFAGKPAVVGHRGFGRSRPGGHRENTAESCLAAVAAGLTWIEIDVQRTADGELVLRHDWTAPDGSWVADLTAGQLARQGVERLDDLLAVLPPGVALDIDVKTVLADATEPEPRRTGALLAAALQRHAGDRKVLVTSFDPGLLVTARPALRDASLGLLTWLFFPLQHAIPAAVGIGADAVALHTGSFPQGATPEPGGRPRPGTAAAIEVAHQAGLEVLVWCPDPEAAVTYAACGADAVCVDDVPGTLDALRAWRG